MDKSQDGRKNCVYTLSDTKTTQKLHFVTLVLHNFRPIQ